MNLAYDAPPVYIDRHSRHTDDKRVRPSLGAPVSFSSMTWILYSLNISCYTKFRCLQLCLLSHRLGLL